MLEGAYYKKKPQKQKTKQAKTDKTKNQPKPEYVPSLDKF